MCSPKTVNSALVFWYLHLTSNFMLKGGRVLLDMGHEFPSVITDHLCNRQPWGSKCSITGANQAVVDNQLMA